MEHSFITPLVDAPTLEARISTMARELRIENTALFDDAPVVLLALMNGAFHFASMLHQKLCPLTRLETMRVSSYHGAMQASTTPIIPVDLALMRALKDKHVILVDDILDTGNTLAHVMRVLERDAKPKSIRTVVLLEKERVREGTLQHADAAGFVIEDKFVVGFGLDYQGKYRGLPYIGVLDPLREAVAVSVRPA